MTGYALATALAAPVDEGMMLVAAARPARQSAPFIEPSTVSCEAVGGARRARDDSHRRRVVLVLVDADDEGRGVGVLRRSRDDHLLGAALDVLHAALGAGESAGRLADVLDAGGLPRDLSGVAGRRQGD